MMVDTTIYGYVTDGAVYHPRCIEDGETVVGRLYYLDDEDPHGLTCDGCGEYIFEPVAEHPGSDKGCDYGCHSYCGEGADCWLHVVTCATGECGHEHGTEPCPEDDCYCVGRPPIVPFVDPSPFIFPS